MTPRLRRLTRADARNWEPVTGKAIFGGDLVGPSWGYTMSAMAWQFATGAGSEVAIPTDEVWVVTSGEVLVRWEGNEVRAGTGDALLVPRAMAGTAEAISDTELLTIANPPSWTLDEGAWRAMRSGAAGATAPRKLRPSDAQPNGSTEADRGGWQREVTMEGFGLAVQLARPPEASGWPATGHDFDEAVAVTSGALEVTHDSLSFTVEAGHLLYRPGGHAAQLHVPADTELVVVRPAAGG